MKHTVVYENFAVEFGNARDMTNHDNAEPSAHRAEPPNPRILMRRRLQRIRNHIAVLPAPLNIQSQHPWVVSGTVGTATLSER